MLLLWFNLIPLAKRGSEFQVHADGSVSVRRTDSWEPLMAYQYATVTADGNTFEFTPPPDGHRRSTACRPGFSREYGVRLKSKVSAEFFRRLLAGRGFEIEGPATGSSFTASRR
ncbi:MAG: hypothetical protein ACXWZR_02115 [Mycobacterium sp.]